ncbi:putative candidate secreted effector protein [Blumeria hordei DH14]|uniref:Putative candidate secreted effector protein n=1 Tax=Blumeria graminis f. sp. hordei (strain DH14) TaxID=546991 RepID=N1JH90_BLUG1|nr:putative candidate secreted effector protein [Blumeria hordei DH14]
MKGLSPLYMVLTSLLVYTISANVVESDFICERDVVPKERIKTALTHACSALGTSSSKAKYPAAYDASTLFFIHDAILFSWPVTIIGDSYFKGHAGTHRLLLDSSCKFFGMISTNLKRPDTRCYQPVKAVRLYDLSLSSGPSNPTVFRGYRCQNEIFVPYYQDYILKKNLELFEEWKSRKNNVHVDRSIAVDQLFQTTVYLLPSEIVNIPYYRIENFRSPYFIVINPQLEMLGMVFRSNNIWTRCEQLHEQEPIPPQSSEITKNSIGETIIPVANRYICGPYEYSRKSIISHMSLACNMLRRRTASPSSHLNGDEIHKISISQATTPSLLSQILRLPEALSPTQGYETTKKRAIIMFDKKCNYHGTFWYYERRITRCTQLQD